MRRTQEEEEGEEEGEILRGWRNFTDGGEVEWMTRSPRRQRHKVKKAQRREGRKE